MGHGLLPMHIHIPLAVRKRQVLLSKGELDQIRDSKLAIFHLNGIWKQWGNNGREYFTCFQALISVVPGARLLSVSPQIADVPSREGGSCQACPQQ